MVRLMRQRRWAEREVDKSLEAVLSRELDISPLLAKLLVSRGVSDPVDARRFLNPSLNDLADPFALPGMKEAAKRIVQGLNRREKMLVWGDEDCDGVTATAVMLETLSDLGSSVSSYIPSRVEEGIGLSQKGLERAKADGVGLIITVDCGITNNCEVEHCREAGIDVVITDHHEPRSCLPRGVAVVNPRIGSDSGQDLAGVGVAFKVAQGVSVDKLGITSKQYLTAKRELLPLVLFGSVADRVPLKQDNRIFAKFGLLEFSRSRKPGLQVLRETSKFDFEAELGVKEIFKSVIPVLSAGDSQAGRSRALELLISRDEREAGEVAASLLRASQVWLARAREAYSRVLRKVSSPPAGLLVVVDSCLSPNLLSYCASRLKEQFGRPAVVIGSRGQVAVGEGRAPEGFDLLEAFRACEDLLLDYGGHKPAAGFSLEFSKVREFVERMKRRKEEGEPGHAGSVLIDEELPLSAVTSELLQEATLLAPFGEANPPPLFLAKRVLMEKVQGGYQASDSGVFLRCKYFEAEWVDLSGKPIELDIVYQLDRMGELSLRDARPSAFNE